VSYVESQLLPGERVQYQAHLHKILFWPVALALTVAALFAVAAWRGGVKELWWLAAAAVLVAVALWAIKFVHYKTSEFAVTDRRVIIKVGWIQRRTLETML